MLPIVVEDQVLGVLELASMHGFTAVHRAFLELLMEQIGVNVNSIVANARTDELLGESQRLTAELQARSEELQARQEELQSSNAELEEKAALLVTQNRDIETKNLEIEQARQELEARAQQLTLASKYKSEFLANMSHELRTPLNSLLILAQLLAQNPTRNLTAKQVEYAKIIHSAGSDLLQLINDILDLSKVEAGKMDVSPEQVSLRGLLDYVEATFRPMTSQRNLDFRITVAPGSPTELLTDDSRLRQVLRNLLSNAVKFTEVGVIELHIERVEPDRLPRPLRAHGPAVAFRVADSGIGIAEHQLESIFGAFQQADGTTSRKYGGTGLGLSISREIAQLLGGFITAESTPGEGSTFTFSLPVARPDFETRPPGEETRAAVTAGDTGAGLVVPAARTHHAAAGGRGAPARPADARGRERRRGPGRQPRHRHLARRGRGRHRGRHPGGRGRAGHRRLPLRGAGPGPARAGRVRLPRRDAGRRRAAARPGAGAQQPPPRHRAGAAAAVPVGRPRPGGPLRPRRAAGADRAAPVGGEARRGAAAGPRGRSRPRR